MLSMALFSAGSGGDSTGVPGTVRRSHRLRGDNGGGLKRQNPFRFLSDVASAV